MGTGIPSVRDVTQPSNGSVGRTDVVRPAPCIILPISQNTLSLLLRSSCKTLAISDVTIPSFSENG